MIVRTDGRVETNSNHPTVDWYNEDNYIVDETKEDNQVLIQKIKEHAPYMELVVENGKLVDINPTERPPKPISKPTEIELLQEDNASLWYENMIQSARVEANEAEVSGLWYELMQGGM